MGEILALRESNLLERQMDLGYKKMDFDSTGAELFIIYMQFMQSITFICVKIFCLVKIIHNMN